MGDNVLFNGMSSVHAGSKGVLTTSDTCLTPPYCVPIPYTNIAKSSDSAMTANSVKVNGNPICTVKSNFAVSQGDAPGSCGGIISGTVQGKAEFITFSGNILAEGNPVVRNNDKMVSNNKNTSPMPLMQSNGGKPPELADEAAIELEAAESPNGIEVTVMGGDIQFMKGQFIESEEDLDGE
ncbi:MAG: DUF4150 domain-containing protein [Thiohalomonadales bacterium]